MKHTENFDEKPTRNKPMSMSRWMVCSMGDVGANWIYIANIE